MATTKQKYTVHRAMHGEGRDYARGDTRELTEVEAAPLVATGALAKQGEVPLERGEPVQHTFGTAEGGSPVYISAATGKPAEGPAPAMPMEAAADVSDSRVEGRRSPARKG